MKFNKITNLIKKHALEEFPNECCGFIVRILQKYQQETSR
jgi:hypothetical protein